MACGKVACFFRATNRALPEEWRRRVMGYTRLDRANETCIINGIDYFKVVVRRASVLLVALDHPQPTVSMYVSKISFPCA